MPKINSKTRTDRLRLTDELGRALSSKGFTPREVCELIAEETGGSLESAAEWVAGASAPSHAGVIPKLVELYNAVRENEQPTAYASLAKNRRTSVLTFTQPRKQPVRPKHAHPMPKQKSFGPGNPRPKPSQAPTQYWVGVGSGVIAAAALVVAVALLFQ